MNSKAKNLLKSIGPGILFAGAAIGASHLVQSTRAGAGWGWELLPFVILANFFKYPFFEYGHRYAAATGESIISGYKKLGNWAVITFFILNILTSVISTAGVTFVTAALSANLLEVVFGMKVDMVLLSYVIMGSTLVVLLLGKYSLLDKIVKILIVVLTLFTLIAFIAAVMKGSQSQANFISPPMFDALGFAFLISLMGWMPAPIEASAWSSLWAVERAKQTGHKPSLREALIDFNIGYIGTAVLAVLFVGLGALVMYGTGEDFSNSPVSFSKQLITLYTSTLGEWTLPIISIVALVTMASTTITVVDAYPRSLDEAMKLTFGKVVSNLKGGYWWWAIIICISSGLLISSFQNSLKGMVDFATTVSFIAAPIFSIINYKTVNMSNITENFKPNMALKLLSYCGIIYLIIFSLVYIYKMI